jgi:hypothetical protein
MMKKGLLHLVLMISVLLVAGESLATLTGARATPRQVTISASRDNVVSITWRVSATSDHRSGVSSPVGTIIDPGSGQVLSTANTSFDAGGAGPFTFRENLVLDAATVQAWVARGIRRVVLQRTFGDPVGNTVNGSVVLRLTASQLQSSRDPAPAELFVTSLRLEFGSGNNAVVIDSDASLQALLTVQYTGAGVLRGRWQLAEPESPDDAPIYRTLALVNTNLATSQRSTLRSPELPTHRSGRYLLRFCVTSQVGDDAFGDPLCPNPALSVLASYRVQGSGKESIEVVRGLSPDRQSVDAGTVFTWQQLAAAHVYQLQVFELGSGDADLPASREQGANVEPRFVTGIVLDSASHSTNLSELMRSKLQRGHRYQWRVTAHDETGRMIGRSAEATFIYAPAE